MFVGNNRNKLGQRAIASNVRINCSLTLYLILTLKQRNIMINKSFIMIWSGLLLIIIVSVMLYLKVNSPILHVLLAVGFIAVGAGILAGFIKMVSEDKN